MSGELQPIKEPTYELSVQDKPGGPLLHPLTRLGHVAGMATSIDVSTADGRLRMYHLLEADAVPAKDMLNKDIVMMDYAMSEPREYVRDDGSSEIGQSLLILLDNGSIVSATGRVIPYAVMRYGMLIEPPPWKKGVRVRIEGRRSKLNPKQDWHKLVFLDVPSIALKKGGK